MKTFLLALLGAAIAAGQGTSIPKFTGPIPVTADSYPFMDAAHSLVPYDLSKYGYVEQEEVIEEEDLAAEAPGGPAGHAAAM